MTAAAPPAGSLAPPGTGFSPADRPSLHRQLVGEGPILYVFCHGLFGQGRNWAGIARRLLPDASLLADLPNHGRSPWTSRLDCGDLAQSVVGLLKELRRDESNPKTTAYAAGPPAPDPAAAAIGTALVGHSLGGRAAMLAALRRPDLVPRLVIADSAPLAGPAGPLARYATALQELDLARLSSRQEADRAMATAIPDPRIRGFLLASLRPSADGSWSWLFNLDVLARDIDAATAWPDLDGQPPYPGPVLWLLGQHSGHVPPAAREQMRALFPRAVAVTVKAAGHWVHADQPAVVSQAIRQFAAG